MKIVIWHYDRFPTAPGVYLGCFPSRGHSVTWVTSEVGSRNQALESNEGSVSYVKIQRKQDSRLPRPIAALVNRWNKFVTLWIKIRVMSSLAGQNPDVLQVRDLITEGLLALFFARRNGVRFAFQFDYPHSEALLYQLNKEGRWSPFSRLKINLLVRLRAFVLRHADLVFPISGALADLLEKRFRVSRTKMVVFPVGVPSSFITASSATGIESDHPPDGHDVPTVCYMGNLSPIRDPGMIFTIMERVFLRLPETRLLLIGGTNPLVDELIERFPYKDRIEVTGFLAHEQIPETVRRAHVGLFVVPIDEPSYIFQIPSPLKVVEYLGCAIPVVSSRVPDAVGVIEACGGGDCVENEPEAFATAILDYLQDRDRARRDGLRGQSYIRNHRVFEVLANEVEAAYVRLLETGSPADRTAGRG